MSNTNRLSLETSPYLLQHAHNPVDWYAWGDEALQRAKREDKPILLSIGYSACHWCHVMERESFENDSIAGLMNANFVCIKVDREERPDLDQIYMTAVQIMTGSGGWPLTVFLMPSGEPFYGGTYFPPDDRYGRPGFPKLLEAIADAYRNKRDDLAQNGQYLVRQLNRDNQTRASEEIGVAELDGACRALASRFDPREGGFGGAPKFPAAMNLDFLLRFHSRTQDAQALQMVTLTLDKMAYGGMYDQVGGGFHRYSTDDRWLVPHFEKMLYDNALLARAYLDAWRSTRTPLYRRITEETLDFVIREMRSPDGGFYSTQDADSEGVEGKFYVWGADEFKRSVGNDASLLADYFDVSADGNFEHQNILNVPVPPETFSKNAGLSGESLESQIRQAKERLFAAREQRIRPGRDEKILTDWNGLMLRAFAEAALYLKRDDYKEIAVSNAEFLLRTLWKDGRLLHNFKDGRARFNGYLDDYANVSDGLLALYEVTFDPRWLELAVKLVDTMVEQFWDAAGGGFFFTGKDHETLVSRTKDFFDNATPAGNSVAADVLVRLAALLDRRDYRNLVVRLFQSTLNLLKQYPSGFGRMLSAADFFIGPAREIAFIGSADAFLEILRSRYQPRVVLAGGRGDIALLKDRRAINGQPTAYVCENQTCMQPVTDAAEFERQL
jgi:hypothetical protein